jgi:peptidoglycan/LPS O-acetylase OafA/YrhL
MSSVDTSSAALGVPTPDAALLPHRPTAGQTTGAGRPKRITDHVRLPVLDGVRGLAILMTIFVHATRLPQDALRPVQLIAAWACTGVSLFFVLSGFLITGILFDAKTSTRYFRNFYARRFLRIFPVYYAVLVFALIIAPHLPAIVHYWIGPIYSGNVTWSFWLYLANFTLGANGTPTHFGMLDVTWSLSIEEQFYLLWPLIVLLLSRKQLVRLCVAIMVGAFVARVIMNHLGIDWQVICINTLSNMDLLAAGALIALAARGPGGVATLRKWALPMMAIAIVGMLAVLGIHSSRVIHVEGIGRTAGNSFIALLYCSGVALLLLAPQGSMANRVFGSTALGLFGRYSYAMYLFHPPILWALGKFFCDDQEVLHPVLGSYLPFLVFYYLAALAVTLAAALVSWNLLERHCLALKRYFRDDPRPATQPA